MVFIRMGVCVCDVCGCAMYAFVWAWVCVLWSEDRSWLSALLDARSLSVVGLLRCPQLTCRTSRDALVPTAETTDLCAMWITFIWVLALKVFSCLRGKHFTYWSIHSPSPFIHIFNAHKIRVCRDALGCQLLSSGFFFMCSLVLTCYHIL